MPRCSQENGGKENHQKSCEKDGEKDRQENGEKDREKAFTRNEKCGEGRFAAELSVTGSEFQLLSVRAFVVETPSAGVNQGRSRDGGG